MGYEARGISGRGIFGIGLALFLFFPWPSSGAIVGTDHRHEWFEEPDPGLRELGLGTAALVPKSDGLISPKGSGYVVTPKVLTHGAFDHLCTGVAFADQLALGSCSGFLVGPDLLMTAAHCLKEMPCENLQLVFDFLLRKAGDRKADFAADEVYSCRAVVREKAEEDWALLRLDRPTHDRGIFRPRAIGAPALGSEVVLLGYPRGMPLKIAGEAHVAESSGFSEEDIYFEADLETFGGNSGSPVVNRKTLELEGIDAVGFGEFEDDEIDSVTGKTCHRLRKYDKPADVTPSWVVRATLFASTVKEALLAGE